MLIDLKHITKIYPSNEGNVTVLKDVTVSFKSKSMTGICGPSGSGKTTLLTLAGLLDTPTSGEIAYNGKIISHANMRPNDLRDFRRDHFGFIFQKANLIPFLTAEENVAIVMEINNIEPSLSRIRAQKLLEKFGVQHRNKNFPHQLSGGEQQRIAIARALANNPPFLLADEPTAALDGDRGEQVLKLLRDLADQNDVAVCVVTHDPRWDHFFDQKVTLADGQISSVR